MSNENLKNTIQEYTRNIVSSNFSQYECINFFIY